MTAADARVVRAASYRRLATAAADLAEAATLDNVREKHEHAAARWTELAELDEQPSSARFDERPGLTPGAPEPRALEKDTPCTA